MVTVRCYYCGSDKHASYAEENGFSLVKCDVCGLLFVEKRPCESEITQAHMQGSHSGSKELEVTGKFNPRMKARYREILGDLFDGDLDGIRTWLDVGCGHGEFMLAVGRYGSGQVRVKGTDPNVHKQAAARGRGLDVGYWNIGTQRERYDAISMLNVWSHLPDPPSFLASLRRLLNPGGELILETGDTADLPSEVHHRPFLLPDHLSFASERIVVGILERLDFEVLRIEKYPFVRLDLRDVPRELLKVVLPRHKSALPYQLMMRSYPRTDMFIRARLQARTDL